MIRNTKSAQFQAVHELTSSIRWCITGTPIQNSIEDLGALVRFLRLPTLRDANSFRKYISGARKYSAHVRPNHRNLQILLESICLRRNQSLLCLPDATLVIKELQLSEREREQYDRLYRDFLHSKLAAVGNFQSAAGGGTSRPELESYIRLRMFCNVGFHSRAIEEVADSREALELLELQLSEANGTYHQTYSKKDPSKCDSQLESGCRHEVFPKPHEVSTLSILGASAKEQLPDVSASRHIRDQSSLPDKTCDKEEGGAQKSRDAAGIPSAWSTKISAILADVSEHVESDKRYEGQLRTYTGRFLANTLSIVFSCWRQSLDVLGQALREKQIAYCRVDGLLNARQRGQVLKSFGSAEMRVLLVTFGTGATG